MSSTARTIALLLLLIVGVQLWLIIGRGQYGSSPRPLVFFAVVAVASLPPVFRRVSALLEHVRRPTRRTQFLVAMSIWILASVYFVADGFYQHRQLTPRSHDEHMHLLQVQMLARGRLWMPAHPAADSFESFHIFAKPKYASIYFPGTALLYVPAVWLRLPYWLMPAIVAGGVVALMYHVTTELIDGLAGLLAALLLASLSQFRLLSLEMMSYPVMVLLGLGIMTAWLAWRRSPKLLLAAAIGALGGWAAITRPVDAIYWSTPVAVAMLLTMRRWPVRKTIATLGVIAMAATPFLALQLALNVGLTGRWFQTPYRLYSDLYTPGMSFGFHEFDSTARPRTTLLQRQMYYDNFTVPIIKNHRPDQIWPTWRDDRLPGIARLGLPSELLIILMPCAALALRGTRWALAAVFPLFIAMYVFFPYLLAPYVMLVAPAVIFVVLLGMDALIDAWPRVRPWIETSLAAVVVMLCVRAMPEFNRLARDDTYPMPVMEFDARLPQWVKAPAIVLYHFDPVDYEAVDPVYNTDVAWPDDAAIIRANDLPGEGNRRLFEYYAAHQPSRRVYRVDRAKIAEPDYRPVDLGDVSTLAKQAVQ